jgi:hypothetical protein
MPPFFSSRLADGDPFDQAQREPFALDDLEAFGADPVQRAAGEVLALQRHPPATPSALMARPGLSCTL